MTFVIYKFETHSSVRTPQGHVKCLEGKNIFIYIYCRLMIDLNSFQGAAADLCPLSWNFNFFYGLVFNI